MQQVIAKAEELAKGGPLPAEAVPTVEVDQALEQDLVVKE